ncbi:hypothetical protein [Leptospira bandrabouensis]|uniref:Uncharacterized protein n=1 Tax=Leptospira bandrabouensis TaxID=2484903 RepID=A0A6H3NNP6_9LEPT|nr:hypothetical protein [Leptospira bandrabouensis]MCG6146226.1 hypothetical protein [Leptospira bandrabouensis]MCG6153911.1 hypothetical protein [Leptospira bandrabouensis]MCG6161359.1 hypothetical protein [Leptospira bandrabouensis]MCG6165813.1 hypothetical protein [Leptospira bandrabouensis]MCW7457935.1 hypothetical protein [Leptospira bandrabouensis]
MLPMKNPFLSIFLFVFCLFSLFGKEKNSANVSCKQKEETVKTIFQLLPDSERSCIDIAKLVLTEEDEEGEKLDKEYTELFLKVCELKRKKLSLEEIRENLGFTKQCSIAVNVLKKN